MDPMKAAAWFVVLGGGIMVVCGAAMAVPVAWLVMTKVVAMLPKKEVRSSGQAK